MYVYKSFVLHGLLLLLLLVFFMRSFSPEQLR